MKLSDYVLRFRQGEGEWQAYELIGNDTLIGRGEDNDLVLQHREISRHHLRIRYNDGAFLVTDLESSNGTQIDGIVMAPQVPVELRPGQMLSLGDFTLVLEILAEGGTHISRELLPYILRVRFGSSAWQTYPIEPGEKILGRDPECDFPLNDSEVSRHHARLQILEREIFLTDLGSTNGTKIRDLILEPEQPYPLQLGQTFAIGSFILQVDEPSRFYQASSAVSGRARKDEAESDPQILEAESVSTIFEANILLADDAPARALSLASQDQTKLGRAPENHAILQHPLVSAHHAVISSGDDHFRIQDLGSAHGVFVNGKRIEREVALKDWDQIRIGPFSFVLSGQDLEQQVVPGLQVETKKINQFVSRSQNLLQNISLRINPNDLVAIIGHEGVGKMALLKALAGIQPASHGEVLVNEIDLYAHYDLMQTDIGFVPQSAIVHTELTPESALDYAARLRFPPDLTKTERAEIVTEMLTELELTEQRSTLISRLSRGHARRVSIGCEMLIRPRLFFLDEPLKDLDPGEEYDLMKLLRRLADRGRTTFMVTYSTNHILLCDKVVCLTADGNLAFFGSPEEALIYFDPHRTDDERRDKEMGFDDIYRILGDAARSTPIEWGERYLTSQAYYQAFGIDPSLAEMQQPLDAEPAPQAHQRQRPTARVSVWRQFLLLSARNLRVLWRDKASLLLMLSLAPLLGLLDFVWGRGLYDPISGDARKLMLMWVTGALVAISVGAFSGMREIVKETNVFKRERSVHLKIAPYLVSKVGFGVTLAFYQAGVLMLFRLFLIEPEMPFLTSYLMMYITLFLGIVTGYLIGLLISAIAPNQNVALALVVVALALQALFAGGTLPLDTIPGGKQISVIMPVRWSFEALVRTTGFGDQLASDPCWAVFSPDDRTRLPVEMVENCPCLGASIFSECADFPGILSPQIYDQKAQVALKLPAPLAPQQPTAFPTPIAILSPTPFPTPTLLPSLTPYPTPRSVSGLPKYIERVRQQGDEYQQSVMSQFEAYQLARQAQYDAYLLALTAQGTDVIAAGQKQADQFASVSQIYNDELANWQKDREPAIQRAEALLGLMFDHFQQVLMGFVWERWLFLGLIQVGLAGLLIIVLKLKKTV